MGCCDFQQQFDLLADPHRERVAKLDHSNLRSLIVLSMAGKDLVQEQWQSVWRLLGARMHSWGSRWSVCGRTAPPLLTRRHESST